MDYTYVCTFEDSVTSKARYLNAAQTGQTLESDHSEFFSPIGVCLDGHVLSQINTFLVSYIHLL
jgi:hypothetical protein